MVIQVIILVASAFVVGGIIGLAIGYHVCRKDMMKIYKNINK